MDGADLALMTRKKNDGVRVQRRAADADRHAIGVGTFVPNNAVIIHETRWR
jgi:hypothetical protein